MMLAALARGASALAFSDLGVPGAALGALVGDALRIRRSHVEEAMTRAGIRHAPETARGMYESLGTSAVEVLWMAGARRNLDAITRFDAEALKVVSGDRAGGVVLAASHTGNWEIASCAVAQKRGLLVVTKHLSVGWVDAFWQTARGRYGVSVIGARGAFDRARAHVRQGGMVAMMIDQVPVRRAHALALPFLGASAFVDRGPATLAARTGALFVVPAARRLPGGMQEVSVLEVMVPEKRRDWIDEATARATAALDRFVRAHATEWLWMHRRWKCPVL